MVTSIIGIAVNFAAAALLAGVLDMGVGGLALAAAVSSNVMAICLLFMINKRRAGTVTAALVSDIVKIVICGAAAYAAARSVDIFAVRFGGGTVMTLIRLCVCALPAALIYFAAAYALNISGVRGMASKLKRRFVS